MPLFGLIDRIIMSIFLLAVAFGFTCYIMMMLHEWFSFKPRTYYRPSVKFVDETGKRRFVDPPSIYLENTISRADKLKWYHHLIVGP